MQQCMATSVVLSHIHTLISIVKTMNLNVMSNMCSCVYYIGHGSDEEGGEIKLNVCKIDVNERMRQYLWCIRTSQSL